MKYLSETELDALIQKMRDTKRSRNEVLVMVDSKMHIFKLNSKKLRNFLGSCLFPPDYKMFRNALKGLTINLDV